MESAALDKAQRSLRERRVEALRHLEALHAALQQDGATLLDDDERSVLERAMRELDAATVGTDARLIETLTEQLNALSRDFAGRRMDAGIRAALAGQQIDAIGE